MDGCKHNWEQLGVTDKKYEEVEWCALCGALREGKETRYAELPDEMLLNLIRLTDYLEDINTLNELDHTAVQLGRSPLRAALESIARARGQVA